MKLALFLTILVLISCSACDIDSESSTSGEAVVSSFISEILSDPSIPPTTSTPINHDFVSGEAPFEQVFYGEWQIVQFVDGGRFQDSAEIERFVGQVVIFERDNKIVIGGEVANEVSYSFAVTSLSDSDDLWGNIGPTDTSDVTNTDFVVCIFVHIPFALKNESTAWVNSFYIKSSNTIIFQTDYGLLKATRIGSDITSDKET